MPVRVALTFDAEAGAFPRHNIGSAGWEQILDLLGAAGITATFFVTGAWAAQQPALTRRTVAEGHVLANHTLNHLRLGERPGEIQDQLDTADGIIGTLIPGMTTRPWMRLPGLDGDDDPEVLAAVAAAGYEHVRVNVDSRDWDHERFPASWSVAEKVISESAGLDPVVILMHSWPRTTPTALRLVIDHFVAAGATLVTIADLTAEERRALPRRARQPASSASTRWRVRVGRLLQSQGSTRTRRSAVAAPGGSEVDQRATAME